MDDRHAPDTTERPAPSPRGDLPQVRTLLLTDLCESTALVERLGDALAAALFREHDRLVLKLQQRWHGRLIDRSDGLLLLFERPIDGLGFALDYMRGLHELGQARRLNLQARAGLHVGEVLTWHNSDEAVRAGAKSLEVEGLAKPFAGRLMSLARPGQILLSAVAEPMSHRAAGELGERGQHLVWKSHGRWRFKGVPNAQEIFEVGEPGLASLRMPAHSAKAWRDIPLWRRPAALAAEVLLVVGLGTGAWFLTRAQPAIAFNERDWVVVGDLRNLTGQPVLDESLEQAFRISLEQSRYVNVLSDLKVRDTLALMKRQPDEPLDRATASEVAIRDGARAVILPTVAEVGGRVRVSAEVVDPHTQTTVYAESADGAGAVSALQSIDKVTAELRNELGEAVKSIDRDSAPLPQVSTANLDALKAYALGNKRRANGDDKAALGFYERAIEFDPEFALAILAKGQMYAKLGNLPVARRELDHASKVRSRLSGREALMLDANIASYGPTEQRLDRWQQLLDMYPDSSYAHFAIAQDGMFYANRYESGLAEAKAASVPQYERESLAIYLQGMLLLGMERYRDAIVAFDQSRTKSYKSPLFYSFYPYAALRDWASVERLMGRRKATGVNSAELDVFSNRVLFAIDRGRWEEAEAVATEGITHAMNVEPMVAGMAAKARLEAVRTLRNGGSQDRLLKLMDAVDADRERLQVVYPAMDEIFMLGLGYTGARMQSLLVIERSLAEVRESQDLRGYPLLVQMQQVLLAERDRLTGRPAHAIERLKVVATRDDATIPVHAALLRSAQANGRHDLALREAKWLAAHRGRAYVEMGVDYLPTPFNVADTTLAHLDAAEALAGLGRHEEAKRELALMTSIWGVETLPDRVGGRREALMRE